MPMRIISFVMFSCFFFSCKSQIKQAALPENKDNNSLLWEISGKDLKKPSYLFGTLHLMCKNDIKFSENLLTVLKGSDEVYFEMDLDDPSNTLGAIFFMNMKDNIQLKDLYSTEEYNRLNAFFRDSLKMSLASLQRLKPTMIEALIVPKLFACKTVSGIEQELLIIAQKEKKEIKGFENIQFQASVFDSIPYAEQAKTLLKNVDSITEYKLRFNDLVEVYKKQQLDTLASLLELEENGIIQYQDLMLNNRNKNWVKQLKDILPQKSVFIAVGTGHLTGKLGVIQLLKNEGYTVRPIQN